MPHWKKLHNPDYIGSWGFDEDEEKLVTISRIVKDVPIFNPGSNKEEPKPVIHFKENVLPLIINPTNSEIIGSIYSDDYDDWIGKKITLYVDHNVKVGGKKVGGVRVRPKKPDITKPKLTPDHKKWDAAKQNIADGNTALDDIRKHYEVSDADAKKLVSDSD